MSQREDPFWRSLRNGACRLASRNWEMVSLASKPAGQFKGHKHEAEIILATGLSFWNNLKYDAGFISQLMEKLRDGKDTVCEMLSWVHAHYCNAVDHKSGP